jgi:hypothetical protein
MVEHACNLSTQKVQHKNCEFEVSQGHIVRPYLKINKNKLKDKCQCQ